MKNGTVVVVFVAMLLSVGCGRPKPLNVHMEIRGGRGGQTHGAPGESGTHIHVGWLCPNCKHGNSTKLSGTIFSIDDLRGISCSNCGTKYDFDTVVTAAWEEIDSLRSMSTSLIIGDNKAATR